MKKILFLLIAITSMIFFAGCSQTGKKVYKDAKTGYKVVKSVVKATGYKNEKLSKIDRVASSVDESKTVIEDTLGKKQVAHTYQVPQD
jgi:prefoldin subunit 5